MTASTPSCSSSDKVSDKHTLCVLNTEGSVAGVRVFAGHAQSAEFNPWHCGNGLGWAFSCDPSTSE